MLKNNYKYIKFVKELSNVIKVNSNYNKKNITFMCIGTSKVTGDSIGPIVGTKLKNKLQTIEKINIIGDCCNNLHYENINKVYFKEKNVDAKNLNQSPLIIVIDSALSEEENIGKIFVQNRGLRYGEGLNKKNRTIGNISIKAVVGKNFNNKIKNFYVLNKVSQLKVNYLADIIVEGIIDVVNFQNI